MNNGLTFVFMVKLGIAFGLPFVIVMKLAFLVNYTTFMGDILTVAGLIFFYVVSTMMISHLVLPKCIVNKTISMSKE